MLELNHIAIADDRLLAEFLLRAETDDTLTEFLQSWGDGLDGLPGFIACLGDRRD